MNKRFEDINKRFEDMHNYMTVIFVVLELIQGFILVMIGILGLRMTRSLKEMKEAIEREVIHPKMEKI